MNSRNEKFVVKDVPKNSLHLPSGHAAVKFSAEQNGEEPAGHTLDMVAYSGGMILDHWWWGDLVIDVEGITFKRDRFPILRDHLDEFKIGHTGTPLIIDYQLIIDSKNTSFVDTEDAKEFIKLSGEGFPFQASIYAIPQKVEEIETGKEAAVNGFTVVGPCCIWRESEFQEASVCVFGYDRNTKAGTLSDKDSVRLSYKMSKGGIMGTKKKKYKFQDDSGQIVEIPQETVDEIKEEVVAEVMQELQADGAVSDDVPKDANADDGAVPPADEPPAEEPDTSVPADIEAAKALLEKIFAKFPELKGGDSGSAPEEMSRIRDLENKLTNYVRKAEVMAARDVYRESTMVWQDRFANSILPEGEMRDRIMTRINPMKFKSPKDGTLNVSEFAAAVDKEVKLWEKDLSPYVNRQIDGFSSSGAGTDGDSDDQIADHLFKLTRKKEKGGKV